MKPLQLTAERARAIILHAGGLSRKGQFGKGKEAVYKLINHLGFVQIDTNYVVERAHHHAIAARVPDYNTRWLEELQNDGRIFEYWTYATGFIPMENFRFTLPVKHAFVQRRKTLSQTEVNLMNRILDRIGREGPLMARDFENDRTTKSTGWWDWRPSKVALERLFFDGSLIATRRKDFQKRYDLTENIVPADIDQTPPETDEYERHVIVTSLKALGIGSPKDVAYRARYVRNNTVKHTLQSMVENGEVLSVTVAGLTGEPLFMLPEYARKKIDLANDIFILSPFDGFNVMRHRLRNFFDFDYMVECFVPEPKRKYGYFALPVLMGDRFIARMDAKADRKQRTLIVNNMHFEKGELNNGVLQKLSDAIRWFADFNVCDRVQFIRSNKPKATASLKKQLQGDSTPVRKNKTFSR